MKRIGDGQRVAVRVIRIGVGLTDSADIVKEPAEGVESAGMLALDDSVAV